MRDYLLSDLQEASDIDLHTFNSQLCKNLLNPQKTSPGVGSCLENREKNKTKKKGEWGGGGGSLETGGCSLRI